MASIDACTDRAFQAYLTSPATDWRVVRLLVTMPLGTERGVVIFSVQTISCFASAKYTM